MLIRRVTGLAAAGLLAGAAAAATASAQSQGARSLSAPGLHPGSEALRGTPHPGTGGAAETPLSGNSPSEVIERYCVRCHNERRLLGNMSLESFDAANAPANGDLAERVIRKLRAGLMPPPGSRRPDEDDLNGLIVSLEAQMDQAALGNPNPGRRSFQRLNRAEYEASVRDLLDLEIDAGAWLPLDTRSANFDNIADAQLLSATLADGYLRAAADISRLALGDPHVTATESTYRVSRWDSQTERAAGAPYGTRGGAAVVHNFPADGWYGFRVSFHHETTGALFGNGRNALHTRDGAPELLEISIDGDPVAVLEVGRWMHASDPDGVNLRSERVFVRAGPRQVAAAFVRRSEGPLQDLISPHDWSLASTSISGSYGFTALPHLRDMAIGGPHDAQGVSATPSRAAIFGCRPGPSADAGQERACAREIVARLGSRAYRRPLADADVAALMALYDAGAEAVAGGAGPDAGRGGAGPGSHGARTGAADAVEGGAVGSAAFEEGVRLAVEGILASPHFIFRFEEPGRPAGSDGPAARALHRLDDHDLAARLSFFLWGSGPDDELARAAGAGGLADREQIEAQVRRMLGDPRSRALATRFAAQWLRLQDLEKIQPDVRVNPDFDEALKRAMVQETELFFDHLVRSDGSVMELFTSDRTFVNERLARHYGISDVAGDRFRQVRQAQDERRGILGHGSVLTLTSHAGRTSPVLRGKWVMEVLLGTPPPPPPPDVPELEEEAVAEGRLLTVRERLEEHRANPSCNSCHRMIDPIGVALEHFDVTGALRVRDQGVPIDAASEFYDGTPIASPSDLRAALLKRPEPLLRTFAENLMAYALGRRLEYYDMPAVRRIVGEAAADNHRVSAFIVGVATSDAFLLKAAPEAPDGDPGDGNGD